MGCFLACATAGAHVEAQTPPSPSGDAPAAPGYTEAIGEAVVHYSAGRWRQAQQAFARAHALQPSARTHRGLGLCAFYLDDFAQARQAFEQALADTRRPLPEDQRRELAGLLVACARETGRIELRVTPASARVELDGALTEQRVLFLGRGEHVLSVSAEGHAAQRMKLSIAGGEERSLELGLVALERDASPPALPALSEPNEPAREAPATDSITEPIDSAEHGRGRTFTWIAAAAVPVFAGTAAAVWFIGQAEHDTIDERCVVDRCDRAEADRRFERANLDSYATWTNVSLAASGVALVAAAVLFVVEGEDDASGSDLELRAVRSGAALHGRF